MTLKKHTCQENVPKLTLEEGLKNLPKILCAYDLVNGMTYIGKSLSSEIHEPYELAISVFDVFVTSTQSISDRMKEPGATSYLELLRQTYDHEKTVPMIELKVEHIVVSYNLEVLYNPDKPVST